MQPKTSPDLSIITKSKWHSSVHNWSDMEWISMNTYNCYFPFCLMYPLFVSLFLLISSSIRSPPLFMPSSESLRISFIYKNHKKCNKTIAYFLYIGTDVELSTGYGFSNQKNNQKTKEMIPKCF